MELVRELLLDSTPQVILIVALCKASLVLAIAQLLVKAMPWLSAATKHLMLTFALAAFVAIPALALFGPDWRVRVTTPPVVVQQSSGVAQSFEPIAVEQENDWDAANALLFLWAAGALVIFARLGRSAMRLRRIVNEADEVSPRLVALLDSTRVRLLRSNDVAVPMVWGVRRGTLLLPSAAEQWTDEELRVTFLHELAHLQRLDYVSLYVMNVVTALAWFQPQVWFARRAALMEGERACDDVVLRAGARASEYASHLLEVARATPHREPLAAFLAMSRRSQLEGRMLAILSPSTNRRAAGVKALLGMLALFAVLSVPFATLQLFAQPVQILSAAIQPQTNVSDTTTVDVVAPAPVAAMPANAPAAATLVAAPVANPAPVAEAVPVAEVLPAVQAAPVSEIDRAAVVAPADASVIAVAPVAEPVAASAPVAAAPPLAAAAPSIPFLQSSDVTRPYRVLRKLTGRAYTLKLNRPLNTGDPSANPAEQLALRRLAALAAKRGADAVLDVHCGHELRIGFAPPAGEACTGKAIVFTD
ncbi:MAG: M56 family metallopeptidase [Acidobacteriota bacterium]|nr:M56 family metallopeptidase [Acidobacteriota bacterium]